MAAKRLGISSLRDAELARLGELKGVELMRARHVITENERVTEFVRAAEIGDVVEMGRLVTQSHLSLRDDYEVSCEELDFLVEAALQVDGVYGARMMGGGFGGSTVNLVQPERVETVTGILALEYQRFYGLAPEIHLCVASSGASEIIL